MRRYILYSFCKDLGAFSCIVDFHVERVAINNHAFQDISFTLSPVSDRLGVCGLDCEATIAWRVP